MGTEGLPYTFSYVEALGRDCFMMGGCGYRILLAPDGQLRRFDDREEETASTTLSQEERVAFLERLEAEGFFELPALLPVLPEGEMGLGGRVVTMTFEQAGGSRGHQIEVHTDAEAAPLPEAYYAIDEVVRSALLDRLGSD